jgi:hypothetical protein
MKCSLILLINVKAAGSVHMPYLTQINSVHITKLLAVTPKLKTFCVKYHTIISYA